MKATSTHYPFFRNVRYLLAIFLFLSGSLSFGQTTENYSGVGTSPDESIVNGMTAYEYGDFTYQITELDGQETDVDLYWWVVWSESGTSDLGVTGADATFVKTFKIKKTDGASFTATSLWIFSDFDDVIITGYNDNATTGQTVTVSAGFSGIQTLNFTGVDELRFEGTEIIIEIDDFAYTLGAANAAPTATALSAPSVSEDDTNVALADNIQVADTDGDDQTLTFTITGGTLTTGTTGITFGGNGNGSASFTASGTLAAINTALDAATFTPTPNLSGTNAATISFTTNDGTDDSNTASVSFDITAVNDTPVISIDGSVLSYTENNAAIQIDAAATVTDPDGDADWNGGQLAIELNSYIDSSDEISVSDTDGDGIAITISGANIFANGTDVGDLVPSGGVATGGTQLAIGFDSDATNAIVQQVFRSIRYRNTSDNPGTSERWITISALDAVLASKTVQRTIGVTAVNDDPTISGLPTDITVTEDIASNVDLSAATLADVDAGANSIVLTITTSTGTLSASTGGSVTIGGSGTGTLTLTGTVANIDTYLNIASNIKYTGASNINGNDAATLSVSANDGGYTGTGGGTDVSLGTVNVDITAVNDKPTASNFSATTIYEGTPYVFSTGNFAYSDVDGNALVKITFNWVPENGILYLDADNGDDYDAGEELANGANVSKANLDNGNLQYLNTDGISSYFEFVVNDGITYSASIYTATLTVSSAPTVTLSLDPSSSIAESSGTTNLKATLSNSFNKDVTVNLLFSGTATGSATDYTLPASSIIISAGNTSNSIQLSSVSDALDEDNESIIIDVVTVTNGTEDGTQQVTATILDDDYSPTLTTNSTLNIDEAASATLSSVSHLSATDADDNDAILIFTVTTNTSNGALKKSGSIVNENGTFTQADLTAGIITYAHDGTNTDTDSFVFKVSDEHGNELTNQTFSFVVTNYTQIASLTLPATSSTDNSDLNVDFSLPEAASPGTLKMTFMRTGGTADASAPHVLTFATGFESATQHITTLDGTDLSSNANVASVTTDGNDALVDGAIYSVSLEYQDVLLNAVASITSAGLTYDNISQLPTLALP
uniref:cadherin-like domain-containing protein n=1 Tax=Ancylomarina sp. TaxID=1970196 RepID=UPI0035653A7E